MDTVVVYYSKTGNTKKIAEAIASSAQGVLFPLNYVKKGRKTKAELEIEAALFKSALDAAVSADLVIIGTPAEFRMPQKKVMEFIANLKMKKCAVFCTYYGMPGAVFIDMEAELLQNGNKIIHKLGVCVGTEKYKFQLKVNLYKENITEDHISRAAAFADECKIDKQPIEIRLKGICGADCTICKNMLERKCRGAAFECRSGKNCEIFNCCVIKQSLMSCDMCGKKRPAVNCLIFHPGIIVPGAEPD